MAGRALMPLHDNPDSERLVEWMNKVPQYSLNDQKPYDWTPFQGCDYCNGLCSVLESADCVRRLLDGQRVPIFQGRYEELGGIATRGCKFAKCLMWVLDRQPRTNDKLDRPIDLAFRRFDESGPSSVQLLSLIEGDKLEGWIPFYLAVATAGNDPASTIACRIPDPDLTSPQNLTLIKRWLYRCISRQPEHWYHCPDMMSIRTELPTRVVYVGTDDEQDPPRLYSGNGEIAGYVALSYCWGGSQRHQTEKNRIERYMDALPLKELPKSLQDAIILTRALGIRYIWIDSLCIMQDCDEDKHREITRMANIYKNAIFTISAARAKSCEEGFLGVQNKRVSLLRVSIKLPMNCLNGAIGSVVLYPSRVQFRYNDGIVPIARRSWTYQEQLLSRRVVSLFKDAMEWSCYSCHLSDDRLGSDELGATDSGYLNVTKDLFERSHHLWQLLHLYSKQKHISPKDLRDLSILWWRAVQEYTLGSLSNLDDKLPAIAGIASEFHSMTGDVYIAGLWKSHLIRDLQWRTCPQFYELPNDTGNRDPKYDAPTWTWASTHECTIWMSSKHYDLDSDRVEIIDCKVNLVSAFAPFGSVNGGELKIRAPLKFLNGREPEDMLGLKGNNRGSIGGVLFDGRSRRHVNELTSLRGGEASPIESTEVWFLGLSKHADLTYEPRGLALTKRADGLFERIGLFEIYVGDDWLEFGTAELDELRSSWGDDYVVTDVTTV